jgi:hypothetical protein
MLAHLEARAVPTLTAAVVAAALVAAVLMAGSAPAAADASLASAAAAKRCASGKVAVRRPGRSTVCAKRCPSGRKHKVSARGRVSCVRKRKATEPPPPPTNGPAPPAGDAPSPPADQPGGPAAGSYSGNTEQSRPVTFKVADGQVTDFEAGVNTWCSTQGNQRINFDAIAGIPPMAIGPDGSFSYSGPSDTGNMEIRGVVTGNTATGTVGMNRGDTNYSGGQMYFGSCSASDVKWSAALG